MPTPPSPACHLLVPALGIALGGCASGRGMAKDSGAAGVPEELAAALDSALEQSAAEINAPGVAGAVLHPAWGLYEGSAGMAVVDETPMRTDHLFRIGSITKTFVAATALELAREGRLDLDLPVSTWVEVPFGDQVTLRQCLDHSAGYQDFAWSLDFIGAVDQPWTPQQLLAIVDDALLFPPGTDHAYSNSGYIVAGLVIEAVTGEDYANSVRERFLDPQQLAGMALPSEESLPGELSHGYLTNNGYMDMTDQFHPTGPWASGEMVGTVADLVHWGAALYGGQVLQAEDLEAMTTSLVLPDGRSTGYGLGCYVEELELLPGQTTLGHSGSTQGFQGRMRYLQTEAGPVVVGVQVNNFASEADVVDAAVWAVLEDEGWL